MSVDKLRGIVLKEYDSGENSKRIVVLTREIGKVILNVKGGRGCKSKFLSSTQLFCYSDFVVYEGRGFLSVTQAEVVESFYAIRQDIIKLSYSAYLLELVEKTILEGMQEEQVLQLLLRTLTVISKTDYEVLLAVSIFEIKYLQFTGLLAEGDRCTRCGKEIDGNAWFAPSVGMVCAGCKEKFADAQHISGGAQAAISYVLNNNGSKIFAFKVSTQVGKELRNLLERYITEHIDQRFATLDFAKKCLWEA